MVVSKNCSIQFTHDSIGSVGIVKLENNHTTQIHQTPFRNIENELDAYRTVPQRYLNVFLVLNAFDHLFDHPIRQGEAQDCRACRAELGGRHLRASQRQARLRYHEGRHAEYAIAGESGGLLELRELARFCWLAAPSRQSPRTISNAYRPCESPSITGRGNGSGRSKGRRCCQSDGQAKGSLPRGISPVFDLKMCRKSVGCEVHQCSG